MNVHGHSFPSLSSKRSKQLVYVNTNLKKILKGANAFGEQMLSLKDMKTAISNSQIIKMLQTHVNNNIYNKYWVIHNKLENRLEYVPRHEILGPNEVHGRK